MSGKLVGEVYKLKLKRAERDVLLAMAENADAQSKQCFPGVGYLAWKAEMSERQIKRVLSALESQHIIVALTDKRGGKGQKTIYLLQLDRAPQKPPYQRRKNSNPQHDDLIGGESSNGDISNGDISRANGDILNRAHIKERARAEPSSLEPSSLEPSGEEAARARGHRPPPPAAGSNVYRPNFRSQSAKRPDDRPPHNFVGVKPHGIPADFGLTAQMRNWAKRFTPDVNVEFETLEYVNFWSQTDHPNRLKSDWARHWENQMFKYQRRFNERQQCAPQNRNPQKTRAPDTIGAPPGNRRPVDLTDYSAEEIEFYGKTFCLSCGEPLGECECAATQNGDPQIRAVG